MWQTSFFQRLLTQKIANVFQLIFFPFKKIILFRRLSRLSKIGNRKYVKKFPETACMSQIVLL